MTERNEDMIPEFQDTEEYKKLRNAVEDVAKMAKTREEKLRCKNWYENLEHLQCGGKLCEHNCVLCTLLWICREKFGVTLCGRQLEKVLTWYAGKKITEIRDLQCDQLMNIVTKCGIAERNDYDYNDPKSTRIKMINKVWKDILAFRVSSVRLLILGKWHKNDEGIGHCVVCDLEKTRNDRMHVMIYDPQAEKGLYVNEKKFTEYVKEDGGLYLYTVNIDVLRDILEKYRKNLHIKSGKIRPMMPARL